MDSSPVRPTSEGGAAAVSETARRAKILELMNVQTSGMRDPAQQNLEEPCRSLGAAKS
jgi:hypothetical protein